MKILKLLALSVIIFQASILLLEVFNTFYTDIPDIIKKNNSLSKHIHVKILKTNALILFCEIILLISAFYFCIDNELIKTVYIKDGIQTLLLFLAILSDRLKISTFRDAISISISLTIMFLLFFKYLNFYIYLFMISVNYFLNINHLFGTGLIKDNLVKNDILPEKIQTWIKDNNYISNVYYNPSYVYNLMIYKSNNILDIFIIGNWSNDLFNKSACALLFHELGHAYYDTKKYLIYWSLLSIFLLVLSYLFIYYRLLFLTKELSLSYNIFLYVFVNVILLPFFKACLNGYRHYHEYLSDNFSVQNGGREGLINYFYYVLNIDYYNNNQSFLYGLFYNTHPGLLNRINKIKETYTRSVNIN